MTSKRGLALKQAGRGFKELCRGFGWFCLFGVLLTFSVPAVLLWAVLVVVPAAVLSFVVRGDWEWSSRAADCGIGRWEEWMELAAERSRVSA